MITFIGMLAAILGTLSVFPQLLRTLSTRDVSGLSIRMYGMVCLQNVLWIIYGAGTESWPLVVGNMIVFPASAAILVVMNPSLKEGACPCLSGSPLAVLARDFGPHDDGLGPDVQGRVDVRMGLMPTVPTSELCLRGPIGFIDHAAFVACPGGVARIDGQNLNSGELSLVGDELPELMERPSMHASPLPLAKPYPAADARQFFEGNAASGAFGSRNERLGNAVVRVLSEAGLTAGDGLEPAADGARALALALPAGRRALERAPGRGVALAAPLDVVAGMEITVAGGGDVGHTQIDAEEVGGGRLRPVGKVDRHQQEPLAVAAAHEVALANGGAEALGLIAAHHQRHGHTAGQGQQRDAIQPLEAHHALVEGHRRQGPEARALGLVPLVRLADLRDAAHRHLRRQAEPLAQRGVMSLLERDLVSQLRRKRLARQPVGARIEGA